MKTLDEVIKAYEVCHASVLSCEGCPYDNGERYRDSDCYIADALHYLMEYRDKHDEMLKMEEALGYCEMADNRPLTWEELRGMEGKPVWVELPHSYRKAWGLNDGMFTDAYGNDCITVKVLHDLWHLQQKQMGETWQAYRKERG